MQNDFEKKLPPIYDDTLQKAYEKAWAKGQEEPEFVGFYVRLDPDDYADILKMLVDNPLRRSESPYYNRVGVGKFMEYVAQWVLISGLTTEEIKKVDLSLENAPLEPSDKLPVFENDKPKLEIGLEEDGEVDIFDLK